MFVISHPEDARKLLQTQPQLAYALFQAMLMNNIVDPSVLQVSHTLIPRGSIVNPSILKANAECQCNIITRLSNFRSKSSSPSTSASYGISILIDLQPASSPFSTSTIRPISHASALIPSTASCTERSSVLRWPSGSFDIYTCSTV